MATHIHEKRDAALVIVVAHIVPYHIIEQDVLPLAVVVWLIHYCERAKKLVGHLAKKKKNGRGEGRRRRESFEKKETAQAGGK